MRQSRFSCRLCRWRGLASKDPHRFLVALTPARPRYVAGTGTTQLPALDLRGSPAADDPDGAPTITGTADRTDRPQALIVISSASQLPLAEPRGEGLSIGWSLVELAAVLERFEDTHEFVLATPDGRVPTLDINVLALAMEGGKDLGPETAAITVQQGVGKSGPAQLRGKHPELVARRESELALLRRHRSLSDAFSLADLDFVYAPGGHAPMVDFHDNPVMGELLHVLRENDVPVGLICHAPVAMTSAKYRLGEDGSTLVDEDHAFRGARVTTVPKYGEIGMLTFGYPKVPGEKTRLPCYVDVALKEAGYDVLVTLNPSAVGVVWDEEHGLLTGKGPQSVDAQARKLAEIVEARSGRSGRAPR